MMSAACHIKLGDLVAGIVEAPFSKNRNSDALVGWPRAADDGNSMFPHIPGQWIYDGEIEMNPLILRDLPVLGDAPGAPPPKKIAAQDSQAMDRVSGADMAS